MIVMKERIGLMDAKRIRDCYEHYANKLYNCHEIRK